MAHFRSVCQGNRGKASRLGSKKSGLVVIANGWKSGVRVYAKYNEALDMDTFSVFLTSGSNEAEIPNYDDPDRDLPFLYHFIGSFSEQQLPTKLFKETS